MECLMSNVSSQFEHFYKHTRDSITKYQEVRFPQETQEGCESSFTLTVLIPKTCG